MDLKTLGWNSFFQEHFNQYKDDRVIPARVASVSRDIYQVFSEKGELRANIAGKIFHESYSKGDLPAVGDWVVIDYDPQNDSAMITALLPRQSSFSRKLSGSRKRKSAGITDEQVIATNIDSIFIVMGLDRDFNLRRLERYLTLVYDSGANPVMVLNKSDICADFEAKRNEVETIALGVPIHIISAKNNVCLDTLLQYLPQGKTVALVGSSGAGKSTLINSLLGEERQKVKPISKSVGKGQHVTTKREMIFIPSGGIIIDNPGMRELQLWSDEDGLKETFRDIEDLAQNCRFKDCQHKKEPDCAVKRALEDGTLDEERYNSYLKLKNELWYLEESKDKTSRQIEMAKWERILKEHNLSLKDKTRLSRKSKNKF